MIIYRYLKFLLSVLNHPTNRQHKKRTLIRIIWWKINRILFKLPCIVELVPGIKIICYPNDSLYSTLIFYLTLPEYGDMRLVLDILDEKDNFIDVGGNMGTFSLLAASRIKKGKIFSFEPSPKILPYLYENIALNKKDEVINVIQKAVSDRVGYVEFDISSNPDYNHIVYSRENKSVLRVGSVTLDKFISDNNLNHIKLVKIDVEGAELLVLKGLQESFQKRKIDALIIEASDWAIGQFNTSVENMISLLNNFEFKSYIFDKDYKLIEMSSGKNNGWNIIAIHKSQKNFVKQFNHVNKMI